ncbi:MAG: hypothetical protein IM638_03905 [Bacteroidetes bacterium]|nr:hypothetical protein [Bacteroidota bacterium]
MAIGVLVANRYLRYVTPVFESTTFIKLADNHDGPSGANLFNDFDVFATSNKINAEVELIKSGVLLEKAAHMLNLEVSISRIGKINKTELYKNSPITILVNLSKENWFDKPFKLCVSNDTLTLTSPDGVVHQSVFGQKIITAGGEILIVKNDEFITANKQIRINDNYEFVFNSLKKQKEMISGQLDVMAVDKEVPVLRISCRSAVPDKAADMANAVAMAYLNDFVETKFLVADTTRKFLDQQLESYGKKLSRSEDDIEMYRDTHRIINIKQETETDLRKISDLKKQYISVQMSLSAVDSLHAAIQKGVDRFLELAPNFEQFTDLLSTEIVLKIKALQAEKKELLTRYTAEHEKVKLIDAKLQDLILYLRESISNSKTALRIKLFELEQGIRDAEAVFVGLPSRERRMNDLERDFSLNEQLYRFLHEKRTEAEIAQAARISFHRIITAAEAARKPVSPNAGLIRILAGFLGMLASVTLIYIVHFQKARVNDADTLQRNTSLPLDASVPVFKNQAEKQLFFRRWLIELELRNKLNPGKVLVFSSDTDKDGRQFMCMQLAAAATDAGYSVLLADADNTLSDSAAASSITRMQGEQLLAIRNAGTLREMMQQWMQTHTLIIWNNGCMRKNPDALRIMAAADHNFLVTDSRNTRRKQLVQNDMLCSEFRLPDPAYVLNRADYTPSILRSAWLFVCEASDFVHTWMKRIKKAQA